MGAMVDVVGMRIDRIRAGVLREILDRPPRAGCKELLIRAAPFDE